MFEMKCFVEWVKYNKSNNKREIVLIDTHTEPKEKIIWELLTEIGVMSIKFRVMNLREEEAS